MRSSAASDVYKRQIVNGAKGKMGQEAVKAVTEDPACTLVATADQGDDLGALITQHGAEVVVDFTHPSVVKAQATTILSQGAHAVIGTTGLSDEDLSDLDTLAKSKKRACLVIPNFAIGAVMMMKVSQEIAKHMPRAEIIEMHHDQKADAPSGTAIKTAQMIHEAQPQINADPLDEKELIQGSRGGACEQIPIHAVRLPGYVASQEVIFGGPGQTLSVRHETINRTCFMPGVLMCIQKAEGLVGVVYGLEKLLRE